MVRWTQGPSLQWGAQPRKQGFYGKVGAASSVGGSSVQATLQPLPPGFRGCEDPI